MSESLVPEEARALVGQVLDQRQGTVHRKEFQRWAAAVGETNPLYFDEQAAKDAGHPDVVMPPLFVSHVLLDVARLDTLRPDGVPESSGPALPLPERRMAGGDRSTFHRHAYPGDVLTATRRLAGLEEKQGRSGAFVLVTSETVYENQHGEPVVTTVSTMIAR